MGHKNGTESWCHSHLEFWTFDTRLLLASWPRILLVPPPRSPLICATSEFGTTSWFFEPISTWIKPPLNLSKTKHKKFGATDRSEYAEFIRWDIAQVSRIEFHRAKRPQVVSVTHGVCRNQYPRAVPCCPQFEMQTRLRATSYVQDVQNLRFYSNVVVGFVFPAFQGYS